LLSGIKNNKRIILVLLITSLWGCGKCVVPTPEMSSKGNHPVCFSGTHEYTPRVVTGAEFCSMHPEFCAGDTLKWYELEDFLYSDTQDQFLIYKLDSVNVPNGCEIIDVTRTYKAQQSQQLPSQLPNKIKDRFMLNGYTDSPIYPMFNDWVWYSQSYSDVPDSSGWTEQKLLDGYWLVHSYHVGGQIDDSIWTMIDLIEIRVTLE
jgi:hypothetical protein